MKEKAFIAVCVSGLLVLSNCGDDEPNPGTSGSSVDCTGSVCILSGTITDDLTLTADREWLLRGGVFIGDDINETVLTIEPGTTIFGESSTQGMLVIRRGSKIIADGTAASPIIFTSSKNPGSRTRGDWGGIVINGRAPVNGCDTAPCESFGEGGTGFYGGDVTDDNSGVLRYVRVEFAGRLVSPDNELNGIAFQAVGSGTTVDYIQVHMNKDDGVEFFGGTVNVKHLLLTGIGDDSMDWTDGWQGMAQFVVAQQYDDTSDNGIEADNNAENNDAGPRSQPILSNFTIIGQANSDASDIGMLLREGTGVQIHNTIVMNFNDSCFDVDDQATFDQAASGNLRFQNSIAFCGSNYREESGDPVTVQSIFEAVSDNNRTIDPQLLLTATNPDFRPAAGSPAIGTGVTPTNSFFDTVDFVGGVDPSNDWTQGWTSASRD